MDFVTDEKALEYLRSFDKKPKTNYNDIYALLTKEGEDFLNKTLVFDPRKRMTVDEALEHPLFTKVRDKKLEKVSKNPVVLTFEKEKDMDEATLRKHFLDSIFKFHKGKK